MFPLYHRKPATSEQPPPIIITIRQVIDLCELLHEAGKACPIKKGPYAVGPLSTKIPNYVPSVSAS